MSLFCDADMDGDGEWYWDYPDMKDFSLLATANSRKCCSCKKRIKVGEEVLKFRRFRPPSERCNFIEENIYGDEVPLADWYMCEECGGLAMATHELNLCFSLGENIIFAVKEYAESVR